MSLTQMGNGALRRAIRDHTVSFPAQVPIFEKQSRRDIQWRAVHLYFVQGWSVAEIASRFHISRSRAGQILDAWRTRAVILGYVQEIAPEPPDQMATLERLPAVTRINRSPLHGDNTGNDDPFGIAARAVAS
jgi:hypothetical protein